MADLYEREIEEDKTEDSMLWLGFSKLLKILIIDENMETFMKYATLNMVKVSIFIYSNDGTFKPNSTL